MLDHRCPFWLFWCKNRWPSFTWWFNHLPGPSFCPKRTPMWLTVSQALHFTTATLQLCFARAQRGGSEWLKRKAAAITFSSKQDYFLGGFHGNVDGYPKSALTGGRTLMGGTSPNEKMARRRITFGLLWLPMTRSKKGPQIASRTDAAAHAGASHRNRPIPMAYRCSFKVSSMDKVHFAQAGGLSTKAVLSFFEGTPPYYFLVSFLLVFPFMPPERVTLQKDRLKLNYFPGASRLPSI